MIREFISNHIFLSSILFLGSVSLGIQLLVVFSLQGYVKASENMKTTRKKVMIHLRNQFEAIYGMDYQVRNIKAYIEKYLLKMRFLGFTYTEWEKFPKVTIGIVSLFAVCEGFYSYWFGQTQEVLLEILFAYGIVLVSLFIFHHIFGIKEKQEHIQIQLEDYLENYLTNRLIRKQTSQAIETEHFAIEQNENPEKENLVAVTEPTFAEDDLQRARETDMEMLKQLIKEMDEKSKARNNEVAVAKEGEEANASDLALLEEFVQSFFA